MSNERIAQLDIVDAQFHIGPGGIDQVLSSMNALGIRGALVDEYWTTVYNGDPQHVLPNGATRPVCPTAELAAWQHPDRFSWVLRVKRNDPEYKSIIRFVADSPYGRALRLDAGLAAEEVAQLAQGGYDHILAEAQEVGLPLFVFASDRPDIFESIAKKFPDLKLVVDHCGVHSNHLRAGFVGTGALTEEEHMALFDRVLALSDYPNIGLKWSHASESFEAPSYPGEKLHGVLRKAINAFGSDRIMWASDYSVIQTGESWAEHLYGILGDTDLTREERENILGATLRRWIDWPLEP